jgi:hypothetical protein
LSAVISSIIATFVTIPFLGYIIVFVISKLVTKKHRKSVQIAIDVTTLLFLIAIHYFILAIWGQSFLWLILLFLIFIAIIFVLMHWKINHDIILVKVFKGYWRLNFLVFGFIYFILLLYGLILRVNMIFS